MPPKAPPSDDNIKVAVRVRPFNQRELDCNSKLVVEMQGSTTLVHDPAGGAPKTFTFDYSYWSFDGFTQDESGVCVPATPQYADQKRVFEDLGVGVVKNAFLGYNAALFAYGQTGSGKSYSMIGYGANKGIVPLTCEAMFKEIALNTDMTRQYQVSFSMLEIYNERVRDLLVPLQQSPPGGLKVRQNPKAGFFVEGLKHVAVSSYGDIEHWMAQGTVMRTTASTKMNETSSRSHMVITVNFKQVFFNDAKQSTTKSSDIHLVDLAGSERADATGATGDRLKEGSAINQSLSTLGNVISALAEMAAGKPNVQVPYRDSVLTKLLHNALGGNSRTIMVAAISPAAVNYDETVSTLRYADRAKRIRNNAVVNESPTDKMIRELKEENARLLAMVGRGGGGVDTQEQLASNQAQLRELEKTWEQRLAEARAQWEAEVSFLGVDRRQDARLATNPYLSNVNEDAQLSGIIKHVVEEGRTLIGRSAGPSDTIRSQSARQADLRHSLQLNGLSVQPEHAILSRTGDMVSLQSLGAAQVFINGRKAEGVVELQDEDRIMLAPNHIYVFTAAAKSRAVTRRQIDFDFIQRELASAQGVTGADQAGPATAPELAKIRDDLVDLLPLINEANAMSEELSKGVRFELIVKSGTSHDLNDTEKKVMVKVSDSRNNFVWLWSAAKFVNRRYLMQELYQQCAEGASPAVDQAKDPFWDPPEDYFLGSVYLYLQSLVYFIDTDETLSVANYQGGEEGLLHVSICICNQQGQPLGETATVVDDPESLVHKRIDFLVRIPYARGLRWVQEDPSRGVVCKYKFYTDSKMRSTKSVFHTMNPNFAYAKQFTVKDVSHNFLEYLKNSALVIEVWGKQGDGKGQLHNTLTRQRTMSRASHDEAAMDAVVSEMDWRAERMEMQREIDELRQEIQLLQVEKSSLEKELTVISLRTNSGLRQPSQVSLTVTEAVQQLCSLHAQAKARLEAVKDQKGRLPREVKAELDEMEQRYIDQANKIRRELDAMTNSLSTALSVLSRKR
eukprot:m.123624 g.123624  ORF g.123624 m.123624 type:complete len:1017 (-) comp9331_c1_seq4:1455-4505(-)